MPTPTTRLGLQKPTGPENQDVSIINGNMDLLDKTSSAIMVNAGVTPVDADLYDGAIVKEKTTGIVWIAQWNGTSYIKKYIQYPWHVRVHSTAAQTGFASDRTMRIANISAVLGTQINSTGALRQLSGTNWTVDLPVAGIYFVKASATWGNSQYGAAGSASYAAITLWRQNPAAFDGQPVEKQFYTGGFGGDHFSTTTDWMVNFAAGESIRVGVWQTGLAGADLSEVNLEVTLITPMP